MSERRACAVVAADRKMIRYRSRRSRRVGDTSNNLGDANSLITQPATATHRNIGAEARAAMGTTGGMLRLSAGLDDADDVIADLKQTIAG